MSNISMLEVELQKSFPTSKNEIHTLLAILQNILKNNISSHDLSPEESKSIEPLISSSITQQKVEGGGIAISFEQAQIETVKIERVAGGNITEFKIFVNPVFIPFPRPIKPIEGPILTVEPYGTDNWNFFTDDKYAPNSRFSSQATFALHIGAQSLTLLSAKGHYYAKGCLCPRYDISKLQINDTQIPISPSDYHSLLTPFFFEETRSGFLTYVCYLQPPIRTWCAADCENGDLKMSFGYRTANNPKIFYQIYCFQYKEDGSLHLSGYLRTPPRLDNDELQHWHKLEYICTEQLDRLLRYSPEQRYISVQSRNAYPEMPERDRKLLQDVYHLPKP